MAERSGSSRARGAAREEIQRTAEEDREPVHKEASSHTLPGGVYKDAEGDGFHNAHGQAVDEEGNVLDTPDEAEPSAKEGGDQT